MHTESAGSTRHVADVVKEGPPDAARPPVPVNVVNATEPPGMTVLCCGLAVGAGGGVTVGVIVEAVFWPSASTATYRTGVAVPVKDGNGSKVTTPVDVFNVYVPSFATVSDVPVHEAMAVPVVQIPAGDGLRVVPVPAASFAVGVNVWFTSQLPVPVSGVAVGTPVTVGVYVEFDVCPVFVVTWYLTGVAVPVNAPVQLAPAGVFAAEHGVNVTTPVDVFSE